MHRSSPLLTRRQWLQTSAAATAAFTAPGLLAQQYPARPMKVIVPFPPGGSADVLTRVLVNAMGSTVGQPYVVDNKAGGGGALGIQ